MDVLQVLINALVVSAVGAILATMTHGLRREVKGEIAGLRTELKGDIAGLRTELKGDIAALRTELKGDIAELRAEVREVRSDLTRVALAVGAERRAGNR